jgi:hypothetical protein
MATNDLFQRAVIGIVREWLDRQNKLPATRFATIAAVDGSNHATVTFDGETLATTKYYWRNSNYTPVVGDRVLMLKVNNSYIVAHKIM